MKTTNQSGLMCWWKAHSEKLQQKPRLESYSGLSLDISQQQSLHTTLIFSITL